MVSASDYRLQDVWLNSPWGSHDDYRLSDVLFNLPSPGVTMISVSTAPLYQLFSSATLKGVNVRCCYRLNRMQFCFTDVTYLMCFLSNVGLHADGLFSINRVPKASSDFPLYITYWKLTWDPTLPIKDLKHMQAISL